MIEIICYLIVVNRSLSPTELSWTNVGFCFWLPWLACYVCSIIGDLRWLDADLVGPKASPYGIQQSSYYLRYRHLP